MMERTMLETTEAASTPVFELDGACATIRLNRQSISTGCSPTISIPC